MRWGDFGAGLGTCTHFLWAHGTVEELGMSKAVMKWFWSFSFGSKLKLTKKLQSSKRNTRVPFTEILPHWLYYFCSLFFGRRFKPFFPFPLSFCVHMDISKLILSKLHHVPCPSVLLQCLFLWESILTYITTRQWPKSSLALINNCCQWQTLSRFTNHWLHGVFFKSQHFWKWKGRYWKLCWGNW